MTSIITVNPIIESILTIIEETNAINEKRSNEVLEKALSANQGTKPTLDCYGRKHAPFDGYVWGSDVYRGGSYLSDEYDFKQDTTSKARIKIEANTFNDIKTSLPMLNLSCGKAWSDSGVSICYMYIEGLSQAQANRIDKLANTLSNELKAKIQGNRKELKEGKQEFTLTVNNSFTKPNYYNNSHDVYLSLTNSDNVNIICSVTAKMWDLVESNIEELHGKTFTIKGTIKDLGNKEYKLNRPTIVK